MRDLDMSSGGHRIAVNLCIIFLQLGLLDDAITHTKDILQKGIAKSKVLELFFKSTLYVFNGNGLHTTSFRLTKLLQCHIGE